MRHRVAGYQLGRTSAQRTALRRNLVTDLFRHGRIQTTEAKAKAIRGQAERMITLAKRALRHGDPARVVHARRLVAGRVFRYPSTSEEDIDVVRKLFDDIAPRFADRPGGYTRITRLGPRRGDAAEMVVIELVEE